MLVTTVLANGSELQECLAQQMHKPQRHDVMGETCDATGVMYLRCGELFNILLEILNLLLRKLCTG